MVAEGRREKGMSPIRQIIKASETKWEMDDIPRKAGGSRLFFLCPSRTRAPSCSTRTPRASLRRVLSSRTTRPATQVSRSTTEVVEEMGGLMHIIIKWHCYDRPLVRLGVRRRASWGSCVWIAARARNSCSILTRLRPTYIDGLLIELFFSLNVARV